MVQENEIKQKTNLCHPQYKEMQEEKSWLFWVFRLPEENARDIFWSGKVRKTFLSGNFVYLIGDKLSSSFADKKAAVIH